MFWRGECFQIDSNVPTYLYSSALLKLFGLRKPTLLKMINDLKEFLKCRLYLPIFTLLKIKNWEHF